MWPVQRRDTRRDISTACAHAHALRAVFKPTFVAAAKAHAGKALFLSCIGDSNGSTAKVMKRLSIKCAPRAAAPLRRCAAHARPAACRAVPCFVGFKGGSNVFQYSGANKATLEEKLAAHV